MNETTENSINTIRQELRILKSKIIAERRNTISGSWLYYKYDLMESITNHIIIFVDLLGKLNDMWITYDK